MKKDKILYIEWIDSFAPDNTSWHYDDDAKNWSNGKIVIKDVGFFIRETKKMIYISGGNFKSGGGHEIAQHRELAIPKGCIIKRKILNT